MLEAALPRQLDRARRSLENPRAVLLAHRKVRRCGELFPLSCLDRPADPRHVSLARRFARDLKRRRPVGQLRVERLEPEARPRQGKRAGKISRFRSATLQRDPVGTASEVRVDPVAFERPLPGRHRRHRFPVDGNLAGDHLARLDLPG